MGYVENLLGDREHLVFRTHQHWMMLVPSAAANLVIIAVIMAVIFLLMFIPNPATPFAPLLVVLVLIPIARFVYHFLIWDNTEYIITNRRVIQVDGIINKNVTDSSLEKVNDVKMSQSVFGRLLDYGDVEILTASELAPNLFRRINHPIKFKTEMLNQKELIGVDEGIHPGVPPVPDVPSLIARYDQLRKQGAITEEEFQRKKQELLAKT